MMNLTLALGVKARLESIIETCNGIAAENQADAAKIPNSPHMQGWYEGRASDYKTCADWLREIVAEMKDIETPSRPAVERLARAAGQ